MPCAGAEGFLVTTEDRARSLDLPFARILGTIERHNAFPDDPIQLRGGWALDRDDLYAQAGAGPADMDFAEFYDDYPVINVMQLEDLGFCPKGAGADFVRRNTFTVGGTLPLNTSGGQLSVGQAGAAGGYLGLTEAVRQLTGQALGAQVENARLGLVSGFGMINYDRGLCSGAAVLGCRMTEPLAKPKPRNPVRALRLPTLPPGARSRAALRLTAAAAEGRFELQTCFDCGAVQYPPRSACVNCLSHRLEWREVDGAGELIAGTVLHHSNELYYRERVPLRLGLVRLDAGPSVLVASARRLRDAPRACACVRSSTRADRPR